MSHFDPYATLQVTPDADDQVIVAAYRTLARRHHPDHAGESATAAMAAINAAWELIGTPAARAAYDREHRRAVTPRGPARSAYAGASPDRGGAAPVGDARARAQALWFSPAPDGTGAAGSPPGRPTGSILPFGRHIGWSLGEVARVDPGYLEWLDERPQGKPYRDEIDALLRRLGRREAPVAPIRRKSGRWGRG